MIELLEFVFQSFWRFIGSLFILAVLVGTLHAFWLRFWRAINIHKHGWPPPHCNADGSSMNCGCDDDEEDDELSP